MGQDPPEDTMASPVPHNVIARSQLWGIRSLAVMHCLLAPFNLLVGTAFVGSIINLLHFSTFEDMQFQSGLYTGLLSCFALPGVKLGAAGMFLAITCNPFLLASIAAAVGLWLRRSWGKRTALVLSTICVAQTLYSFAWTLVLYLTHALPPGQYVASAMREYAAASAMLIALLLPLLWYGPVIWYLTRPGVAAAFSGSSGDCATP
jgi:hypothetical protein